MILTRRITKLNFSETSVVVPSSRNTGWEESFTNAEVTMQFQF